MDKPSGDSLKEKYDTEIKKLRELSFKEKIEYIWDYYKWHIIITSVILIILGSLFNSRVLNPAPKTVLNISWNTRFATEGQLAVLSDALKARIVEEESNEKVEVMPFLLIEDDPMIAMAEISRLVAMLAAGQIDVFILDEQQMTEYMSNMYIQPMDGVLALVYAMNPAVYERVKDKMLLSMYESAEGNVTERIMGIDISDSPLLMELGFFKQELYFCVSATASNIDNVAYALVLFME